MYYRELFAELKDNLLRIDEALIKQQELLKKINEVKIGNKILEQKEVINNFENIYNAREEVSNFF